MAKPRFDIYQAVTDKIIAALEQGVEAGDWQLPWHRVSGSEMPRNAVTGKEYRGVNVFLLWIAGMHYPEGKWASYKQWQSAGKQVARGERGTMVVFYSLFKRHEPENPQADENGDVEIPVLRYSNVFNVAQTEDYEAPKPTVLEDRVARQPHVDEFIAATGAVIKHGGDRAFYRPSTDEIHLPRTEQFKDTVSYYATALHELTHWTKHPSRLDRDFGRERWGDAGYAMEELVAELGAAMSCAHLGLSAEPREDHAQYLASWLQVLKSDKRAIFKASTHAQKAVDHLCEYSNEDAQRAA